MVFSRLRFFARDFAFAIFLKELDRKCGPMRYINRVGKYVKFIQFRA